MPIVLLFFSKVISNKYLHKESEKVGNVDTYKTFQTNPLLPT